MSVSTFLRLRKHAAQGAVSCSQSAIARLRAITEQAVNSSWLKYSVAPQQFQSSSSFNSTPRVLQTA
jgi:hypothetical protein